MGFFDKLMNGLKSEIQSEIKKQINSAFDNSTKNTTIINENVTEPKMKTSAKRYSYYDNNYNRDEDYFDNIITNENFPEYIIEKSVHPSCFDPSAHSKCYPITYLLKKDGNPVLAIFLMKIDQYRTMPAEGTYMVLYDNDINFIRFFKEMENEESYVINRIKENL